MHAADLIQGRRCRVLSPRIFDETADREPNGRKRRGKSTAVGRPVGYKTGKPSPNRLPDNVEREKNGRRKRSANPESSE